MEQSNKMSENWTFERYDERQLMAIVEVLERFNTQEWDMDIEELGLNDASDEVAFALRSARAALEKREAH